MEGSLERAFRLLAALVLDHGQHSIEEVSASSGLPSSTAYRLARMMVERKLIVKIGRGRYVPAFNIAAAGGNEAAQRALAEVARPVLRAFARQHGLITHLGVFSGDMITYIVKEGDQRATLFTREGMQLEAYCSAVGKMMLAQLSESRLDDYLATGPFVALTPQTIIDIDCIRAHLREIRSADFAIDHREVAEDLVCIAVPVRSADHGTVAAISCSRRSPWQPSSDIIGLLRIAAADIAVKL
jgi:IclR family acetate operon transcriptional repressor